MSFMAFETLASCRHVVWVIGGQLHAHGAMTFEAQRSGILHQK
jgi:hypothetical protein